MDPKIIQARKDALFEEVRKAAVARRRCPSTDILSLMGHTAPSTIMRALAQDGRVKVEVYGRNWRVVEILAGPDAGARTEECPAGGAPYLVIDATGRHEVVV